MYEGYIIITSAPIETLKVKLTANLGNYDRPTNGPTEQPFARPTDGQTMEVPLPIMYMYICIKYQ